MPRGRSRPPAARRGTSTATACCPPSAPRPPGRRRSRPGGARGGPGSSRTARRPAAARWHAARRTGPRPPRTGWLRCSCEDRRSQARRAEPGPTMRCPRLMSRLAALLLIVLALALTACGGSGRAATQASSTPAELGVARRRAHRRHRREPRRAAPEPGRPAPRGRAAGARRPASRQLGEQLRHRRRLRLRDHGDAQRRHRGDVHLRPGRRAGDLQKLDTWLGSAL